VINFNNNQPQWPTLACLTFAKYISEQGTWVSGPPNFGSLWVLVDELKSNASSVPLVLGGGQYGHLGLLLSATQYATLSTTPFVLPINSGPFALPDKGTEAQINVTHDVWKEQH